MIMSFCFYKTARYRDYHARAVLDARENAWRTRLEFLQRRHLAYQLAQFVRENVADLRTRRPLSKK